MAAKLNEIKSAILAKLYALYEEKGLEWSEDEATLAEGLNARPGAVEAVLMSFRDQGLIDMVASDSILDVRLTADGIEAYEDPQSELAPYVQQITIHAIHGGSNQFGAGSTQNITYRSVLQAALEVAEERDDVPAPVAGALRKLVEFPDLESLMSDADRKARGT
jgi:hypothetical protein